MRDLQGLRRNNLNPFDYCRFFGLHSCILCRSVLLKYGCLLTLGILITSEINLMLWNHNFSNQLKFQTFSRHRNRDKAHPINHLASAISSLITQLLRYYLLVQMIELLSLSNHSQVKFWPIYQVQTTFVQYLHLVVPYQCKHSMMDLHSLPGAKHWNSHQLRCPVPEFKRSVGFYDQYL